MRDDEKTVSSTTWMSKADRWFADKRQRQKGRNEMFIDAAAAILKAPIDVDAKAAALSKVAIEFAQAERRRCLEKELKEAERALGEELSEQNFAWLADVRKNLSGLS